MNTLIRVMLAAAVAGPVAIAGAQVITGEQSAEGRTFVEARGNVRPVPLPPGGPAPRMADGKVDLSGVWFEGPTGKANAWSVVPDARVQEDPIPFQPWAEAKIKGMTRTELELSRANVRCEPVGTPGMFNQNPYPHQIVMKPGLFLHLSENNNNWRVVYTDGRAHKPKEELEPLFNGDQTAHWEGDILVIDTISLDERTMIQGNGWFHSDQVHVIERVRRRSKNYLEYQYTVEDPKVLTRPWTSAWKTFSLGNEPLIENFCTNNENAQQLRKLIDVEAGKAR